MPKTDKFEPPDKTKKFPTAANHRLLSLMSALYRIESGAQYHRHTEWLMSWVHPDLHGGLPGHEAAEVSWDIQSHIEQALADGNELIVCVMDCWKYFDVMGPDFVRDFMTAIGIDPDYANTVHNIYQNCIRYVKAWTGIW